jgi:arachidonate 15-lipoxygenase
MSRPPLLPQNDPSPSARAQALDEGRKRYRWNYETVAPLAYADGLPLDALPTPQWLLQVAEVGLRDLLNYVVSSMELKLDGEGDAGGAQAPPQPTRRGGLLGALEREVKQLAGEVLSETERALGDLTRDRGTVGNLLAAHAAGDAKMARQIALRCQAALDSDDPLAVSELLIGQRRAPTHQELTALSTQVGAHVAARPTKTAASLAEYDEVFSVIPLPAIASEFTSDEVFARMRVAGPNPMVISALATIPAKFPVTEAQFAAAMPGGDSLAAALAEGRLFVCDYAVLDGLPAAKGTDGLPKYGFAPIALFALPKQGRSLRPVAIQCGQKPGPEAPIFTPADGYNWQAAKACVQVADLNHHELISHLGRTHLFVEPFVVATRRELAPNHPLSLLLTPHFEGTIFINWAAPKVLINPGGFVDTLLASTIDGDLSLSVGSVKGSPFSTLSLPRDLAARGVADPARLPDYPYRDDALLVWGAIERWVRGFLGLYYHDDRDVQGDWELARWAGEVTALAGGRITGFADEDGFFDLDELVHAVTTLVFTASAQHAAVNFPQAPLMSYLPAAPLSSYQPAPRKAGMSEQDWLKGFAPISDAEQQALILYLLGSVHHTTLGGYADGQFGDERVAAPLNRFHADLQEIEAEITRRNGKRTPYEFLLPSQIPQSINI